MSKIDWDKAPEWADRVVRIGISKNIAWACDDKYKYLSGDGPFVFNEDPTDGFMLRQTTLIEQRPSPAWSGEGLPPVGVVCEFKSPSSGGWLKARIVFVSGWTVAIYVFFEHDEHCYSVSAFEKGNLQFRPIRTPEQIAADEREYQIVAIHDAIVTSVKVTLGQCDSWRKVAEMVYDAGFKRPE